MATEQSTIQLDPAGAPARPPVVGAGRRGFWKDALRRRMLATADLVAVFIAAGASGLIANEGSATALWIASTAPAWLLFAKLRGLYDRDHVRLRHQTLDESSQLFHWVALCATGTGLILVAMPGNLLGVSGALTMAVTAFAAAFALRTVARALWRRIVPPERGLIVGSGNLARSFARKLALETGHHIELTGHVGLVQEPAARPNRREDHRRVTLDEFRELLASRGIERVIVALHDLDEETLSHVASECRALGVKLSVAPPLRAMLGTAVDLHHLAELPLIEFRTWDTSRSTMLLKRSMDVVGATVALLVLSPVLLLIALAVKLDSRGPALFRQQRAGFNGDPFQMLKFRTMCVDAADRLREVLNVEELTQPAFKIKGDPRITRVGRILRRLSLDELPQLINVLRGEMSLVGPRPEEVWLVDRYEEADRFRLEMRPGMTGPMQVHGRGELSFNERMSVEREYVENYSLRKDVKILCQTLAAVVSGRGAY